MKRKNISHWKNLFSISWLDHERGRGYYYTTNESE